MPKLPPLPPSVHITRAEREVLEALADGMGYKEAAAWLGITPGGIAVHVHKIAGKLPPAEGLPPHARVMHWLWELSLGDQKAA